MTSTSPTPVAGKSLFASRTVLSLIGAMIAYALPGILTKIGVPLDQQPVAIGYLQQIGMPLFMLLGILFHAISTKPVTSVLPSASTTTKIMGGLALPLFVGLLMSAGMGMSACAITPAPALSQAQQLNLAKVEYGAEAAYNVAGSAYLAAEPALSPSQKATVKGYLVTAYQALLAARQAQKLGDTGSLQDKIDQLQALAADVTAVTKTVHN